MKNFTYEQYIAFSDVQKKNAYNRHYGYKSFYSSSHEEAYKCYPYGDWEEDSDGEFNIALTKAGLPPINYSGRIDLTKEDFPDEDYWDERGYGSLEDAEDAYREIIDKFVGETDDYIKAIKKNYEAIPDDVKGDLEALSRYASWDGPRDIEDIWAGIEFDRDRLKELLEEAPEAEDEYFEEVEKKKFDQKQYIAGYNKQNYSRIEMKVPKEVKENWEYKAAAAGMSLTSWIRNAANDVHPAPDPDADQEKLLSDWIDAANGYYNYVTPYAEEYYLDSRDIRLVFTRDHEKLYRNLLRFCADNGILVISTNPGTLATILRIKTDKKEAEH